MNTITQPSKFHTALAQVKETMTQHTKIYTDGSHKPLLDGSSVNGWAIFVDNFDIRTHGSHNPDRKSSEYAELRSIQAALTYAAQKQLTSIEIINDNEAATKHIAGIWKVQAEPGLVRSIKKQIQELKKAGVTIKLTWLKGKSTPQMKQVDKLARQEMFKYIPDEDSVIL